MKSKERVHSRNSEFYRKLWALVLPIAFQNLMGALVSASDALMLGALDQSSLSAVSLATQVQFVLGLFYMALTIGTTILAAQYWGKGDRESVERVLAIALRFSMAISVVFFVVAFGAPQIFMRIFTNDEELIALGNPYLRIVSWSYLFSGVTQIYLCIMKNSGNTLRSTVYSSATMVLNLLLNTLLIFGLAGCPRMGIQGAALATLIARSVEFFLCMAEQRRKDTIRIRWKHLIGKGGELGRDFLHYTSPVLANELVWGCGFTMFSVIMGHLGNDAVAANSIANIAKNIIACVCMGIGGGSSIIVGNELGGGNLERAKEYGGRLCRMALLSGVVSGGLLLAASPLIVRLASTLTAEASFYLQRMLWICSYYMIGKAINSAVIGGIFCAGGDTKFGFLCDTVTMWVIIVPIGMISAFWIKAPVMVVYFLLNLDELIKLPAVYHHYKKYQWIQNITREEKEHE